MTGSRIPRPRVVIVDDHAGFRATVRRLLEADGWGVVGEAADGRSAIALIELVDPDLVLLDIGLPDIDGFTVARHLADARKMATRPAIVLISSREAAAFAGRLAAAPARGFVSKAELDGAVLRALLATPA
jgi:DNA-binding NarL/FixJ family response regulator